MGAISRGIAVVLLGIGAVVAVSVTVGTGVPPIDTAVDDGISAGLAAVDDSNGVTDERSNQRESTSPSGTPVSVGDTPSSDLSGPDEDTVGATPSGNGQEVEIQNIERAIHRGINSERRERNLSELQYDEQLAEIARNHSTDMANREYFAHVSPDGEDFADRYDQFGYDCRVSTDGEQSLTGAENLASTYTASIEVQNDGRIVNYGENESAIAREIVSGWMNSAVHREHIVNPHWNNQGIGVAITDESGGTKIIVTQNFC